MKPNILTCLPVMLTVLSCIKEAPAPDNVRELRAYPPEYSPTRTTLSDMTPQWTIGDSIWFSNGQHSVIVTLSEENILPDGSFCISLKDMSGKLYAVYPASGVSGLTKDSLNVQFSDSQVGSFGSAHLSAACAQDGENGLAFVNLGAVFKVAIDPDLAAEVERLDVDCPGISGIFSTGSDDMASIVPSAALDRVSVRTAGQTECYLGVPAMTIPAGTTFTFRDKQNNVRYVRTSTVDNVIARNGLMDLSFLKAYVWIAQNSLIDAAWHDGDEVLLTDGVNVERHVISDSEIARNGSVRLKTQLLVKDNLLRGVAPASKYKGVDASGNILIDIPDVQDGTIECADITYAICSEGKMSFKNIAPVVRMTGLPGAAQSLRIQKGDSAISLPLTRRGSSIYYVAVPQGGTNGTIHYFDGNGTDIGSNNVTFPDSFHLWEYGPLRDIASIDLGDGCNNWLGYYPDDAQIPDLILQGTHDAGTFGYDGLLSSEVKCQKLDFSQQLARGVRCFDIRLNEDMNIYHGVFNCDTSLDGFLDACISFLRKHPRETVFCFAKDENCEGDGSAWNKDFQNKIDTYGRDNFIIDRKLAEYELGQLRGKIVIVTRNRSAGSFGYLEGAPRIAWPDDSWTTYTSGGDIQIAVEDSYTADKGNPKKKEILDFLDEIKDSGGFMDNGHRTRWIITYTSGYNGYTLGIPLPERFCDDMLDTDLVTSFKNKYNDLISSGMTFFHDFIEKWDDYNSHLFESVKKK